MPSLGSVTLWLKRLQNNSADDSDSEAVTQLWRSYFTRLVELARQRLRDRPKRLADEEDIALEAFDSFVRAVHAGRFPQLDDRDDLWHILLMLTGRKIANLTAREMTAKRGGGTLVPMSALANDESQGFDPATAEPTPDEALAMAESCESLLQRLPTDELRQLARWKLEGYTHAEIAELANVAVVTVERRVARLRTELMRIVAQETPLDATT